MFAFIEMNGTHVILNSTAAVDGCFKRIVLIEKNKAESDLLLIIAERDISFDPFLLRRLALFMNGYEELFQRRSRMQRSFMGPKGPR